MKLLFGMAFVLATVLGGFTLHHGELMLLVVPTEWLIIGGCLVGSLVISNPTSVLVRMGKGIVSSSGGGKIGREQYVEMLQMVYEVLRLARKDGPLALESHVSDPAASPILGKYPGFLRDHHATAFLCDTLKLFSSSSLDPHRLDELMERDLEVVHHEEMAPSVALQASADALPALGIVACVLGIILTMRAIDQGAAVVGEKVAGALVGTFFGVFLAYGFVGPMAGMLASGVESRSRFHQCLRHALAASAAGLDPATAVEIGRRSIQSEERPSFEELEAALRETKGG